MDTEIFKRYKNSTLFDTPNTGKRISELLNFKFFLGGGEGERAPRPP